ncbi:MAG TPA: serine/threonine-protein kinase, partial [Nannocystis sp.]
MAQVSNTRRSLDPSPGAIIGGKYEIDRLLARGGVGVVYVARERETGREVVIKFLAGHLTGESEASARFEREVERLSGIQHANIVELLDHGQENGAPYLVMEYLSGESLLAYLTRKGRLTLAEFVPIAAQILKALGYAHARGLIHRDIKPGNIMLITRKGRANFVKLLDFGMAKLVEGERD